MTGTKFLSGFLYDRLGLRITLTICDVAGVIAMLLLALLSDSEMGKIFAITYCLVNPVASPLQSIMLPIFATDLFGNKSYDKVSGLFVSVSTAGFAIGSPIMNSVYDVCGTYKPAFFLCAVLMVIVTVVFQFVLTAAHKWRDEIIQA